MPVNNPGYVGTRFTQLCRRGEVPGEIRDVVLGPYSELVRHVTYLELGLQPRSSRRIPLLTTGARDSGYWEQVVGAAQRMAEIIDDDYNTRIDLLPPPNPTTQDLEDLRAVNEFLGNKPKRTSKLHF